MFLQKVGPQISTGWWGENAGVSSSNQHGSVYANILHVTRILKLARLFYRYKYLCFKKENSVTKCIFQDLPVPLKSRTQGKPFLSIRFLYALVMPLFRNRLFLIILGGCVGLSDRLSQILVNILVHLFPFSCGD